MSRRPRSPVVPVVVIATLVGGCAPHDSAQTPSDHPTRSAGASDQPAGEVTFDALSRAADREARDPIQASTLLPPPPGLEARLVAPLDRADPTSPALTPLDATLERLGRGDLVEPDTAPAAAPDANAKAAAMRLYASGRSKLLSGNAGGAILDLESASRMDPGAGAVFRELGEAQLQLGKRAAAVSSFRQAVRRGLREPRTLWNLGRQALREGRPTEAVRFLGAAMDAAPESADPTLPFLVNADLADALRDLGCQAARAEALEGALGYPAQFSSQSRLRLEFGELLRRRGDLLHELGDLYCRLGRYDRAATTYALASLSPSLDPSATLPRLVYVSLRRGRPAEAALTLLEHTQRSGGVPDARTIALVRFLAENAGMGPQLSDGFARVRASLGTEVAPSAAGALARARAAATDATKASEILLAHLARYPDDRAVLNEYAARSAADHAQLVDSLTSLVRRAPLAVNECADAALAHGGNADELLVILADRTDDASLTLRAIMLAKLGKKAEAADLVIGRAWNATFIAAGPACEAVLGAAAGRYGAAQAAFDTLGRQAPPDARAIVRASLALQRGEDAMRVLAASLSDATTPDSQRLDLLITAAGISAATGRARDAENYLNRAVQADTNDERGYAGLFRLYSPGGVLADQNRLTEVIRALREQAPSSRVLRFAAAQELVDRRLDAQAEQLLRGVLDENIADTDAGLLLTSIWDRRAPGGSAPASDPTVLTNAETWLRARIAESPEVHWLWVSLARVLWAQGKPDAAEALLAERLATRPVDELAMMREAVMREGLGKRNEADALALERVRAEPRTISASIEYVDLLVRVDRREEAGRVLNDSVPRGTTLTDDQQATLGIMLARVASKYMERPVLTDAASAALIEEVAARNVRLPPQLHAFRIAVLAARVDDDPALVMRAAEFGGAQHPSLASELYRTAAAAYLQSEKVSRAIPFLRRYADRNPARSADVVFQLVRAVVLEGSVDDVEWVIAQIGERAEVETLLRRMYRDSSLRIPPQDTALRAEFAYRLGGQMAFRSRSAQAHAAYRAALAFDPDHAWTMNDWGYQLLEEGGQFEHAVTLIEGAYARLPSEPNIVDSLGWVRYNQGIFADDPGPPAREGAVTLFKKAAATESGAKNSTIFDHLGDASWSAGLKDEAVRAWKRAEELLASDLMELRRTPGAAPDMLSRTTGELEAVRAKLRAVQAGEAPVVAARRAG